MMPALTSCSLYFPILVRISVSGSTPASDSLLAFPITITRIFRYLLFNDVSGLAGSRLYYHVERDPAGSTTRYTGAVVMSRVRTLYEWIGGLPALIRLTERFYERVRGDAILAPIFA